ncbi:MAG: MFS transporter, partial [Paracoccaceae bacterium]
MNAVAYDAFATLSSFNIGAYLVLVSWTAAELTGDATLVSALFLLSLVLGLVIANVAGVLSDARNVRKTLVWANLLRILAGLILAIALLQGVFLTLALYAFITIRAVGNAFIMTSGSVAFQQIFPEHDRPKRIAEIGILQQIGIAFGTGATGLLIALIGATSTAMILVFVTFAQTPLIRLFAPPATPAAAPGDTSQSFARKWRDGLSYVRQHPAILIPMIVLSATYSVAQLTNVMVPVFVQNDLGAGVATYGTMEMFWAIGGIFVLLLVRGFRPGGLSTPASLVLLSVTGLTMIAFALIRD